jgi:lipopolysaccharide/colanic/teichoic acid biosynthesis glycosyltransferase
MTNTSNGQLITVTGDNRITHLGRILRKTKLDELPQLWNVIKGDIVFVGPRAEVKEYVDESKFSFLRYIKPGITDFSSIILRDEESVLRKIGGGSRYSELLPIKLKLVEIYAINKNFFLDLEIILLTILSIFFPIRAQTIVLEKYIGRCNNTLYTTVKDLLN